MKLIQFSDENYKEIKVLKEEQELVKLIPLGIEQNESLLEGIKQKINASTSSQDIENSIANELKTIEKRFVEQECQIKHANANAKEVEIKWKELELYRSEIIDINKQLEENDVFHEAIKKIIQKQKETENYNSFSAIIQNFTFKMSLEHPSICIKELKSILENKDKIIKDHKEKLNSYKSKCDKLESHVKELEKELDSELEREFHSMEDLCEEECEEEQDCNEESQKYIDGLIKLLRQVSSVTPQNVSAIKNYLENFEDEVYITADKCSDCRTEHRRYGKLTIVNGRLVLNQMTEDIPTDKSIIMQVRETGARLLDGWVEEMRGDDFLFYICKDSPLIRPQRERPPALYVCPMKQLLTHCKDVFFSLKVNQDNNIFLKNPFTVLHISLNEGNERPEIQIRREALIRSCSSYAGESWERIPFNNFTFPYDTNNDGEMFNCIFYKELNIFGKPVMYNLKYGDRNEKLFNILEGHVYAYHVGGFSICFSGDLKRNTNQVYLGCIESNYKIIKDAANKYGCKNIQFGKTYVSLEDLS